MQSILIFFIFAVLTFCTLIDGYNKEKCNDAPTVPGPVRITDCGQLIRQWPKEAILRDEVCNSQCGIYLTGQQASGFNPQQRQGQAQPRVTRSRNQNLFKFSDLTPYIASL
ncbi:hypothetical protein KR200_000376 [Drosophila serrata]|nr:hypothetical protein KR200_000376 [Drosophila serrata]